MKRQFSPFNTLTLLAVGLLAALCSCSKGPAAIYETIPADAATVVKIDAEPIVKALDIKTDNGTLVLPDKLNNMVGSSVDQAQLDLVAKLYSSIDARNLILIADLPSKGSVSPVPVMTFAITDADKFNKAMIELAGNKESAGGYDIYAPESAVVLVKDEQAWILDGHAESAIKTVDALLERAGKNPIAKLDDVADELADDKPVTMIINSAAYAQGGAVANWASIISMQFEADGKKIKGKGHYFTADGKKAKMPYIKGLDTDFLKYVPENAALVLATGIDGDMDWDSILKETSSQLDYQSAAILGVVGPFFKSLEGTTSIAVWPADASAWSNPSLLNVGFTVMIGIKKDSRETILAQINQMIAQTGLTGQAGAEGMTRYTIPSMGSISVGIVDGYVTVTNTDLAKTDNNLGRIFSGNGAGAYINIPSLALLSPGRNLPQWGVKGFSTCEDDEFELEVEPVGTDMSFLQAILNQI